MLLLRGAIQCNLRGITASVLIAAPSVVLIGYIWAIIFHGDTAHFQSQLFIGPLSEHVITDRAAYTRKYIEVHDNDIPIWWGTGRLVDANASVYWKRSPREVATKTLSLLKELGATPPFRLEIPILAFIAVFIGLTSRDKKRRTIAQSGDYLRSSLLRLTSSHRFYPLIEEAALLMFFLRLLRRYFLLSVPAVAVHKDCQFYQ